MPAWTREGIDLVRKRWTDGASASDIAAELGTHNRNAVVGLVHRLRKKGEELDQRPRNGAQVASRIASLKRRQKPPVSFGSLAPKKIGRPKKQAKAGAVDGDSAVLPDMSAVPYLDRQHLLRAPGQKDVPFLDNTGCKWPGWPSTEKTGPCCGLPRKSPAGPYCALHQRAAETQ